MSSIDHVWRALFAGLAAAATVAAGTIFAAAARADISCPSGFTPPNVNPDCYVVEMTEKFMAAHDLQNSRGAVGITAAAHQMCDDMATGWPCTTPPRSAGR
jgi:hypothetical protein